MVYFMLCSSSRGGYPQNTGVLIVLVVSKLKLKYLFDNNKTYKITDTVITKCYRWLSIVPVMVITCTLFVGTPY